MVTITEYSESLWDILTDNVSFVEENNHVVEMHCPDHDCVVATESTVPEWTEDNLAAYECDRCLRAHVFRWGPPTPVYVRDERLNGL